MTRARAVFAVWLAALMLAGALACDRPGFVIGQGCQLNSDCADPLVCVIGYCRRACVETRDCGAGLRCLGSSTGGGCQLDDERVCSLTSQCGNAGLVCQNETCTTPCVIHRDCAPGATCVSDAAGVRACYDETVFVCFYASDCPEPMICNHDQVCQLECVEDRDCPYPRVCVGSLCELSDASTSMDGGT